MTVDVQVETFLCRKDNIGVLLRDPATGACAAIDVPEAAPVLRALERTGWRLTDILVTHRHGDHIDGIPEVKAATGAKVTAPRKAGGAVPQVDVAVGEGDTVTVGNLSAAVWETPGHCDDHVTYWFEAAGIVCAGDTLFTLGCGRVLEGPPEVLWRSSNASPPCPAGRRYSAATTTSSPTAASPSPPIPTTRRCVTVSRKQKEPGNRDASLFLRPSTGRERRIPSCVVTTQYWRSRSTYRPAPRPSRCSFH